MCESAATLNEIAKIVDSLDAAGGGGATVQNRVFKLTRTTPTALSSVLDSVKFDRLAERDRSRALQSGDFVI